VGHTAQEGAGQVGFACTGCAAEEKSFTGITISFRQPECCRLEGRVEGIKCFAEVFFRDA